MKHLTQAFSVPLREMKKIIKDFHSEMVAGLSGRKSSLKMLPAYIDRPTGNETGKFLALDLGGTNVRMLELELKGKGKTNVTAVKKFVLDKRYLTGRGSELFDFLAGCVKRFVEKAKNIGIEEKKMLGFTFSFPVEQTGIASGTLIHWTKGFDAKGVAGEDVVGLLEGALAKNGLNNVRIAALANDTVGTLVTRSYEDPDCDIGVILGTGTNACYSEELSDIPKWHGPRTPSGQMIINIEWGNFNKLRFTNYDRQLDRASDRPGEQILEKMVSGMYLDEIARLVFNDLIRRNLLFGGNSSPAFDEMEGFKTEYMSMIEGDNSKGLSKVGVLLKKLGVKKSTIDDRRLVKKICGLISLRAGRISAAVMAGVITKIDPRLKRRHTIAVDGSVYEKHPGFSKEIESSLRKLFGRKASLIKISLTKDGSGKGAAIMAAITVSLQN